MTIIPLSLGGLSQLFVGLIVDSLLNGGLLTLGAACIFFLSLKGQSRRSGAQSKFWIVYIVALLFFNLLSLTAFALATIPYFFGDKLVVNSEKWEFIASAILGPALASIISLTDGVLVWRCYMVQMALGPHDCKLRKLLWIFPLCIYLIVLVAGSITAVLIITDRKVPRVPSTISLILNAFLNIYATSFISMRLFRLRQLGRSCHMRGLDCGAQQSHRIIRTLVEGAVISVPVSLGAAITNCMNIQDLSKVLLCVGTACQSFSTLAILQQVAVGKAIGQPSQTQVSARDPVDWATSSLELPRIGQQKPNESRRSFEPESRPGSARGHVNV